MAGDWIKWCKGLARKPEVIAMSKSLGISRHEVAGALMEVWEWVDENSKNGRDVRNVKTDFIDEQIGIQNFSKNMKQVGWLREKTDGLFFPRGNRHNGQTAKRRALTKKRVEKCRNARSVTRSVTSALPEKRREDKKDMSTYPPPPTPPGGHDGGGDLGECPFDGNQVAEDPVSVLTPEGVAAMNAWLGHVSWSTTQAVFVAQLIHDHGLQKVLDGIAITAESGARTVNYLKRVVENGSKRLPKGGKPGRKFESASDAIKRTMTPAELVEWEAAELREKAKDVF